MAAIRTAPVIHPKPSAAIGAAPATGTISPVLAWVLGLGWPIAIVVATAIEPAAADPSAVPSAMDSLISMVVLGLLAATGLAAYARHLRTPSWAGALGVVTLGLVAACPASGHHAIGTWWFAQLAVIGAMAAVSLGALRSSFRS